MEELELQVAFNNDIDELFEDAVIENVEEVEESEVVDNGNEN